MKTELVLKPNCFEELCLNDCLAVNGGNRVGEVVFNVAMTVVFTAATVVTASAATASASNPLTMPVAPVLVAASRVSGAAAIYHGSQAVIAALR